MERTTYENIKAVEIVESRWSIRIIITFNDGSDKKFIASADSFFTQGDGIWFGSSEEYEEAQSNGMF